MRPRRTCARLAAVVVTVLVAAGCGSTRSGGSQAGAPITQRGADTIALGWRHVDPTTAPLPDGRVLQGTLPSSMHGRTVLVNFWGSWCGSCKAEMPLLERLAETGKVTVIGVTRDQSANPARKVLDRYQVSYPNVMDPDGDYMGKFQSSLRLLALPESVLVVGGKVTAVHIGPFKKWSDLTFCLPG